MVVAKDYHQEPSMVLKYSCDEGYSWSDFTFIDVRLTTVSLSMCYHVCAICICQAKRTSCTNADSLSTFYIYYDSHHPRIFLAKPQILALHDNPRIAQTNLVCRAESASFTLCSHRHNFLHTFVWSLQASALFSVAKAATYRSRLQVCVHEFREERRHGSLFRDAQLRSVRLYTLRESKPGKTRSYLRWQNVR